MRKNQKGVVVVSLLLLIIITVIILIPFLYGALLIGLELPHRLSWRDRTSPLSETTVKDICLKFNLSQQDARCKQGAVIYAPDFFQTIRSDFIHSNGESVTYDYVQEKIGKYQYEREPMIMDRSGNEYFRCRYDLRGDRVYPIGITFDSKGFVLEFFASTSD
jgi:hypothetical protein